MEALHKGEGGTPPLPFLEWAQGRLGGIPGLPAGAVVGPHTGKAELLGPMVHTPQGERQARSKEFAADYAQRLEGADELESAVQEIVNIRKKHGGGTWSPADRALARGHAVQSKNAFVKGEGFKRTPAQTEFEALDLIIPPNGAAFSMSTDAQLAAAKKLANRWRENARKNYLVPDSTDAAAKPTPGFKEIKP